MYLKALNLKVLISLLVLTSCTSEPYKPSTILIEPPQTEPIITRPVEFKVINTSTAKSLNLDEVSWYGLNAKNYENLAYNMQEILRYLKQQNAVIAYYKKSSSTSNID